MIRSIASMAKRVSRMFNSGVRKPNSNNNRFQPGNNWETDNVLPQTITPSGWMPGATGQFAFDASFPVDGSEIAPLNGGVIVGSDTGQARLTAYNQDGSVRYVVPVFPGFQGKVKVATADVNGDGFKDVFYSPGAGGGAVLGFMDGRVGAPSITQTYGIDDKEFRGGGRVGVNIVNGQTIVVYGAGEQGGPRVAVYGYSNGQLTKLCGDFFMFENTLRDGVNPFVMVKDGRVVIASGAAAGGGPRVIGFDLADLQAGRQTVSVNFFGGNTSWRGGVKVWFGEGEIYAAAIGSDTVNVFDTNGNMRRSYQANGLVTSVGVGDVNGDGGIDMVAAAGGRGYIAYSDPPLPNGGVFVGPDGSATTTAATTVPFGSLVSVPLNFNSNGPGTLHGVSVTIAYTSPLRLDRAHSSPGLQEVSPGLLRWTLGDLLPGQNGSVIAVFFSSDPSNPFFVPPYYTQIDGDLVAADDRDINDNSFQLTIHVV
jgi:hypothetical protein